MNPAALLRRARRATLGLGRHRRPWRKGRAPEGVKGHEQWIRDLLPPTPPAPRGPAEAWAPRITRWVRVVCPVPDDTMPLPPILAATVLDLMARGFLWDPR